MKTAINVCGIIFGVLLLAAPWGSPALAQVDLDITKFKVLPKTVKLAKVKPFKITLSVKNNGAVSSETKSVTVVGLQNGSEVYRQMMDVSAAASKKTKLTFPAYTPTAAGDITWTATIADDDPDLDETLATTTVVAAAGATTTTAPATTTTTPATTTTTTASTTTTTLNQTAVWPCATSGDDTPLITNKHGEDYLLHSGEYVNACKFFAVATITSATASTSGTVTVRFTVEDGNGGRIADVPSANFSIVKLKPASGNENFNKWVPYIYRTETVGAGSFPNPTGTKAEQGYRESNGTFTDHGDGSYTYIFATNILNVVTPVNGTPITYDRTLTHRVTVQMGGHSGPTAEAWLDFVPDGSPVTETRNIVGTNVCLACHGEFEFHGHGGDRLNVEGCVTCHNPSSTDAQGGQTLDMKVMLHKIHVGGELASIANSVPAGMTVWELTEADREDFYAIWGFGNSKHTWWKVEFPAVIENCTKCHQGAGAQVDNWKEVPSRAACGSCHDNVNFATGTNHPGGVQTNDNACSGCHTPAGGSLSVTELHDWTKKDQRHIAEFDVDLTVSTPANGTHFVAGESPKVTVKLTDVDTGLPVSHDTMTTESHSAGEGCLPGGCPPRDNKFPVSALFVHGPRARRVPVLTTPARVELLALNQATYNLSGVTGKLDITFDSGLDLYTSDSALSTIVRAKVSVDLKRTACAYVAPAAATPTEIRDCFNGDSAFFARGIAYLDEATGRLAIRSRNLGDFYSLQLASTDANTAVFNNTTIQIMGGSTVSATLADTSDPKVTKFADRIEYQLDPVDDLWPGTYMVGVEITDRGRPSTSNYKTPSVKKAYFQVKQAAEELAIANNCDSCHQGPQGTGFVLDPYRHNKIFDHTAVDQCGQCHDYQSASATGDPASSDGWNGARPISRRVHAVHYGSSLNYPLLTVNYSNGDPVKGRNWDIEFPQDVRNCETCHSDAETSGTWKTNPQRTPCSGCHDSDEAKAHMKTMTYDPTPANPWSGDEEEACRVCHASN